ncbi:EAL domain-containing protein [Spirulina subsalsa]|uniref:EAL domain-containing protein n=1 Tax=Spirulina subsalsa TaxID=54311 RepID=UPI0002F33081|nr:EAL domain-containing protein [Spirulina subsalsa]
MFPLNVTPLPKTDLKLLNLIQSPVWVIQLEPLQVWWNQTALELFAQAPSSSNAMENLPFPTERLHQCWELGRQGNASPVELMVYDPHHKQVWSCTASVVSLNPEHKVLFIQGVAALEEPSTSQSPSLLSYLATKQIIPTRQSAGPLAELDHRNAHYQLLADNGADLISRHQLDGQLIEISPACWNILGYRAQDVVGMSPYELIHPQDYQRVRNAHLGMLEESFPFSLVYRIRHQGGHYVRLETKSQVLRDRRTGTPQEIIAISRDITSEAISQSLLTHQTHILEMIATNQDLQEILDYLIQVIEYQSEGMIGSILLLDLSRQSFTHCIAPSLPSTYRQALVGLPIGPNVASFGAAAYLQKTVIVTDITKDPRWQSYVHLALAQNLQSCWSSPVFSSQGQILGTFALYYPQPQFPSTEDQKLVELAQNLAGIAIEQHQSHVALKEAEFKYRSIFENITLGIFQTTPQGQYISANLALAKIYGYETPASLIEALTNIADQLYVNPHRRQDFTELLKQHDLVSNFESQIYRRDGKIIWISEDTRAVRNENGELIYYEGTVRDITARRLAEEKLLYNAFHDALTTLPNRTCFLQRVETTIQRANCYENHGCITTDSREASRNEQRTLPYHYAILFLDLDRFKVINDSLGHLCGDQLLQYAAQRLRECVPSQHIVARLGGDEFAILLDDIPNLEAAIHIAESIQRQFSHPFNLNNYQVFTGVSLGIAFNYRTYEHADQILRDADVAMYQAKAKGRNRYAVFNPAMQINTPERLQLENDLRWALERDEFCLYYQPIINLKTGYLQGFEALVRWQHPQKGMISPTQFIPIAEETGLIHQLGWWVLRSACSQLQKWQRFLQKNTDYPPFLGLNVNLSPIQLEQADLIEQIYNLLMLVEIDYSGLKLEITESCLLKTAEAQANRLKQLKTLGIGLCIDDFGTGYSSLSRLHEFPIDTVKIDRSFVQGMGSHSSQTEIVKTIVTLAHSLGMNLVAEGIETPKQLEYIKALGCEFAQGYFFSKPVDVETATRLVRGYHRYE